MYGVKDHVAAAIRDPHAAGHTAAAGASGRGDGFDSVSIAGVVVIDDNRDAAELMAMLVQELGGECRAAYGRGKRTS